MQKITPFLWFDKNSEEAMNFYISVFNSAPGSLKNSKINYIARYEKGIEAPGASEMEGKVITAEFELNGQKFMALDGGPIFKFTESISFYVECKDQKEVDYFWKKLSSVPDAEQCGWLQDKYGLSWQIVPSSLAGMLKNGSKEQRKRVFEVFMPMKKLIVADLEKAYEGKK